MDPSTKLATMFIIVALGTIGTMATTATAFADTEETEEEDSEDRSASSSLERADEAIHEFQDPEDDIEFHQALCLAGISTKALDELGGCEALPPRDWALHFTFFLFFFSKSR
jgi:hypothetical protein